MTLESALLLHVRLSGKVRTLTQTNMTPSSTYDHNKREHNKIVSIFYVIYHVNALYEFQSNIFIHADALE